MKWKANGSSHSEIVDEWYGYEYEHDDEVHSPTDDSLRFGSTTKKLIRMLNFHDVLGHPRTNFFLRISGHLQRPDFAF